MISNKVDLYRKSGVYKVINKTNVNVQLEEVQENVCGSVVSPVRVSLNPETFKQRYEPIVSRKLDIGYAIKALKKGQKVTRTSWKDSNKYIVLLMPGFLTPQDTLTSEVLKVSKDDRLSKHNRIEVSPIFVLVTADDGNIKYGWCPSVEELLAKDYAIV